MPPEEDTDGEINQAAKTDEFRQTIYQIIHWESKNLDRA